ncbi:hypothetical protein [Lactiplantibacillus daowaiensis]|uniref:Uncharacterized protein n=1 Tax=Lactiplantibacillus daowaiensis TaxID=2559918 RepID=A0ABW1S0K0_9LACO|nr:hypothetical protein [Lactiplantibacillus daowaiensis]
MKKQVAGTIMVVDDTGASFLVKPADSGQYNFDSFPVLAGHTPLATVLDKLRRQVGLDVEQLRLFDSVIAEVDQEKVSLFVFNHMAVDDSVRELCQKAGLAFVPASQLHQLFERVHVNTTPMFENLSK